MFLYFFGLKKNGKSKNRFVKKWPLIMRHGYLSVGSP
jgi:hypothetical protein